MLKQDVLDKVQEEYPNILNMNHDCKHHVYLEETFQGLSAAEALEHVLYVVGERMYGVVSASELFNSGVFANLNGNCSSTNLNSFPIQTISAGVRSLGYAVSNQLLYIRAALMAVPSDLPIASTLRAVLNNHESLNSEHVAKLPASLSLILLIVKNITPDDKAGYFFTEDYVKGFAQITEDYPYPDLAVAYTVARRIINTAISSVLWDIEMVKWDIDDEEATTKAKACSYFNSPEQHKVINKLFYNTVEIAKLRGGGLRRDLKNDIERGYLNTLNEEIDKRVINYLKLLA